jgi:hypothetical protein
VPPVLKYQCDWRVNRSPCPLRLKDLGTLGGIDVAQRRRRISEARLPDLWARTCGYVSTDRDYCRLALRRYVGVVSHPACPPLARFIDLPSRSRGEIYGVFRGSRNTGHQRAMLGGPSSANRRHNAILEGLLSANHPRWRPDVLVGGREPNP